MSVWSVGQVVQPARRLTIGAKLARVSNPRAGAKIKRLLQGHRASASRTFTRIPSSENSLRIADWRPSRPRRGRRRATLWQQSRNVPSSKVEIEKGDNLALCLSHTVASNRRPVSIYMKTQRLLLAFRMLGRTLGK